MELVDFSELYQENGIVERQKQPIEASHWVFAIAVIHICQAVFTFRPSSYQWKHNGETVTPGPDITVTAGELTVPRATQTDVGNYTCLASNEFGTAVSNPAQVQFSYLRIFQDVAQSHTVNEGSSLVLPCEAPSGHPTPIISWTDGDDQPIFADGSSWNTDRNLVQGGEGNLVFLRALLSNNGTYRCTASVSARPEYKTFSAIQTVSVISASGEIPEQLPRILEASQVVNAVRGDDVKMHCLATGNPIPTVTWTRLQDQSFSGTGPILSLRNVQQEQEDVYTCTASSSRDQDTATTSLHVEVAPFWIIEPSDTTIYEGKSTSMTCEAGGEPAPVLTWMQNGEHIPEYDGRSSVQVMDLKVYQCVASNTHGEIITNAFLNVTAALLLAPSNVVGTREGTDMEVQWSLLTSADVIGYKVLYWPEGGSENDAPVKTVDKNTDRITINDLKKDTTYYVRVKGYSSKGDGMASRELTVAKPDQGQNLPRGVASTITQSVLLVHLTLLVTFHLL
ncbi:contactin-6-like [Patiria miniata]|uniref:Uncharacterized protein n=1 Tax=Patiria miniata TaxID=46514 RepID=A0A914ASJ9_PATMI|nr:contactin-6-like [Patiria miniata]